MNDNIEIYPKYFQEIMEKTKSIGFEQHKIYKFNGLAEHLIEFKNIRNKKQI